MKRYIQILFRLRWLVFVAPLIIFAIEGNGQANKRNNIWMLGVTSHDSASGLNFNSGTPDTFTVIRQMPIFLANASICDTNGQLLFYTNCNTINNRNHQPLVGSNGFNPGYYTNWSNYSGSGVYQGALILPHARNHNLFSIFHESGDSFTINPYFFVRPLSLRYSIVDMSLDSGYGEMTIKNEIIVEDTLVTGRLTATRHGNGEDWWIITHEANSNKYIKILMTSDTVIVYDEQLIGDTISSFNDPLGCGVFNSEGTKFAYLGYDTTLFIFDFDRCSGILSNPIKILFSDTLSLSTLTCAFSYTGNYLYVNNNLHIFQLDMNAADIAASVTEVAEWDSTYSSYGFATDFNCMSLAPDRKIYLTTYNGTNVIHVINAPDSAGLDCNVIQRAVVMPTNNAFGLPNSVNYSLGILHGSICDSLSIGVQELSSTELTFNVFPNPATSKIYLKLMHNDNIILQIHNSVGTNVRTLTLSPNSTFYEIDISDLSSGFYSVTVISSVTTGTSKFIKN